MNHLSAWAKAILAIKEDKTSFKDKYLNQR
jgi:hypothetical protein